MKEESKDSMPKTRFCICCGISIKPLYDSEDIKPWEGMWLDGAVDKIAVGYGSKFDGDMYVIAVCDKCINSRKSLGIIEYVGDYMKFNK